MQQSGCPCIIKQLQRLRGDTEDKHVWTHTHTQEHSVQNIQKIKEYSNVSEVTALYHSLKMKTFRK